MKEREREREREEIFQLIGMLSLQDKSEDMVSIVREMQRALSQMKTALDEREEKWAAMLEEEVRARRAAEERNKKLEEDMEKLRNEVREIANNNNNHNSANDSSGDGKMEQIRKEIEIALRGNRDVESHLRKLEGMAAYLLLSLLFRLSSNETIS